jgi:hypothetical protein
MIASQRNNIPTVQVQMPPAIHVHPPEIKPIIHVAPADNPAPIVTIEASKPPNVTVTPTINVAPSTLNMAEHKRCSWRHEVHRDSTGRIETIISTPLESYE